MRAVGRSSVATLVLLALAGCSDAAANSAAPRASTTSVEERAAVLAEPATPTASAEASTSAPPPIPPEPVPSMRVRKVDVGAKGDAEGVRGAIAARAEPLLRCYADARALDRTLMGRVIASFTLTPAGHVEKIKTTGDLPEPLRNCVATELRAAALPRPADDVVASVVVEFEPGRVHLSVGGKAHYDVTAADVKAALTAAGCTDVVVENKKDNPKRLTARLEGRHVRVTFTPKTGPANPGAFHLSARQIEVLREHSAVVQASDFVLAIRIEEDDDTRGAAELLGRIVTET